MPKHNARVFRIADQIQRELNDILRYELKDPRVGDITLTGVEVSADYGHAKVFFTSLAPVEQHEDIARALAKAGGFLRSELARRMNTRTVPQLHFVYDVSVEHGMELSRLIDSAVADLPPESEDDSKA